MRTNRPRTGGEPVAATDADVQLPSALDLEVTETEPGLRGDTASGGGTKPAVLETGARVQVPLFVNVGDVGIRTLIRHFKEFSSAIVPGHDVIITEILVVVMGALIGAIGSAVAVRQFLDV